MLKPDVLVVETDSGAFALLERKLGDWFHLVWARSHEAALTAIERFRFDAVVTRADSDESLQLISALCERHGETPLVAVSPWEVQGDRACELGAREWVSAPVNHARLARVLDDVVVRQRSPAIPLRFADAMA